MDLELNENELKLIEAIKAGDVDNTMSYIVENICGWAVALTLSELRSTGLLELLPPEVQTVAELVFKFGNIAMKAKKLKEEKCV